MNPQSSHQYVDRRTGRAMTETLKADPVIRAVYSGIREHAGLMFNLLVSRQMSWLLGALSYDFPFYRPIKDVKNFLVTHGIDLSEAVEPLSGFDSMRKVFERKIRYWDLRPMPEDRQAVVSPADARAIPGSFCQQDALCIKDKFFEFSELLGRDKSHWCQIFVNGDFLVCRLTPDKYHYNHTPVAGQVRDVYEINGKYHSCNPGAVVREVTPNSKNRRVVTILDTDVPGGTGVGRVAMVEVVAMMIGDIVQCYSRDGYHEPSGVVPGMFLEKGCPKSLFRPGSSTTILIFEPRRIRFSRDLMENVGRKDVISRFSKGFGQSLVETEIDVRSAVGHGLGPEPAPLEFNR